MTYDRVTCKVCGSNMIGVANRNIEFDDFVFMSSKTAHIHFRNVHPEIYQKIRGEKTSD